MTAIVSRYPRWLIGLAPIIALVLFALFGANASAQGPVPGNPAGWGPAGAAPQDRAGAAGVLKVDEHELVFLKNAPGGVIVGWSVGVPPYGYAVTTTLNRGLCVDYDPAWVTVSAPTYWVVKFSEDHWRAYVSGAGTSVGPKVSVWWSTCYPGGGTRMSGDTTATGVTSNNFNAAPRGGAAPYTPSTNSWTCTYTVRPGNTLSGIAATYGLTWPQLAQANGIATARAGLIWPGMRLTVPCDGQAATAASPCDCGGPASGTGAPNQKEYLNGQQLAAKNGWPLYGEQKAAVTKYGGAVVSKQPGGLPEDWDEQCQNGVCTIWPPADAEYRRQIGAEQ